MKKGLKRFASLVVGCLLLVTAALVSGRPRPLRESVEPLFETRCGWLVNPTPSNIWLYDKDGEWIIGIQGGRSVEEEWAWPKFKPKQWVKTNGNYGYGCACLRLRANKETREVTEIKSARARPLSACRRDRSLSRWKDELT